MAYQFNSSYEKFSKGVLSLYRLDNYEYLLSYEGALKNVTSFNLHNWHLTHVLM